LCLSRPTERTWQPGERTRDAARSYDTEAPAAGAFDTARCRQASGRSTTEARMPKDGQQEEVDRVLPKGLCLSQEHHTSTIAKGGAAEMAHRLAG